MEESNHVKTTAYKVASLASTKLAGTDIDITKGVKMKLYLVERQDTNETPYDEFSGFVVAAETPERARAVAVARAVEMEHGSVYAEASRAFWLDPASVRCVELKPEEINEGLILSDFNAG